MKYYRCYLLLNDKIKIGGYKARYVNPILSTAYKLSLPTEIRSSEIQ